MVGLLSVKLQEMTVILPGKKERVKKTNAKTKAKAYKDGDTDMNEAYNFDDFF